MKRSPFFEKLAEIQAALDTKEDVANRFLRIEKVLDDPDIRRQFWMLLKDPVWLPILVQHNWFELNESEAATAYPWWPAKYLAEIASSRPKEVAAVITTLRYANLSILADFLDAAMKMPPGVSSTLVPWFQEHLDFPSLGIVYGKIGDFCRSLAENGFPDSSFSLASKVFFTLAQTAIVNDRAESDWVLSALDETLPAFAKFRAFDIIEKLVELIKTLIEKESAGNSQDDLSYIWRDAVEADGGRRDSRNRVVSLLRNSCELAIRHESSLLERIAQLLSNQPFSIFRRLRIHLIRVSGTPPLQKSAILDRESLWNHRLQHEYGLLVANCFGLLSGGEQEKWLGWLNEVPDLELGEAPEVARRAQFPRLHWVRDHLSGPWLDLYRTWHKELGDPEDFDRSVRSSWGSVSPIPVEQLLPLEFVEALRRVTEWKPDQQSLAIFADYEGLAGAFGDYITGNLQTAAQHADLLIEKKAVFVRVFIDRLTSAIRNGASFSLDSMIQLCEWVLKQPSNYDASTSTWSDEREWAWTKDAIASFLDQVCASKEQSKPRFAPAKYSERLWKLVHELSEAPSASYIVRETSAADLRITDFLNLGINSPRGKAIHAALEYARWVSLDRPDERRMSALPKFEALLQREIASDRRTPEVLAVIGAHIGLLYWIDKGWLKAHAAKLFDLEQINTDPQKAYGWAAWNAFLVWVQPHREFYSTFESQYSFAVTQSAHVSDLGKDRQGPMYRLGEHLVVLYGRGDFGQFANANVIRTFIKTAIAPLRAAAMRFVGTSLSEDAKLPDVEARLPDEVIERFQTLWDWYWKELGIEDVTSKRGDPEFGWWIASRQFPMHWAIPILEKYLSAGGSPEPDHLVLEAIATATETESASVVASLKHMLLRDHEPWRIHSSMESVRTILTTAIKSSSAQDSAVDLIDRLGRRGYLDFGALLTEKSI
jgi:hypothetical protein